MAYQAELHQVTNNNGENFALGPNILTTSDVISISEDSIETAPPEKNTTEEKIELAARAELDVLDSFLSYSVRKELTEQMYLSLGKDDALINIRQVAAVISKDLEGQLTSHKQGEMLLESRMIPKATAIVAPVKNSNAHSYYRRDVENLQMRAAVHSELADRIETVLSSGSEGMYDLTEIYIERTIADARKDVLDILVKQKQELDVQNKALEAQIKQVNGELAERDLLLYDNEMTEHLTDEARNLAR
jgi:hypothetical protein